MIGDGWDPSTKYGDFEIGDEIGFALRWFFWVPAGVLGIKNQLASFLKCFRVALLGEVSGSNTFLSVHGRYIYLIVVNVVYKPAQPGGTML